jgi:hypothetical protein
MRAALMIGAGAAVLAGAARAQEVQMDGVVARVVVIPESRANLEVTVQPGGAGFEPVRVRREGQRVVLEGGLDVNQCKTNNGGTTLRTRGGRRLQLSAAPLVTIRSPRSLAISTRRGAVEGQVGPMQNLSLSSGGCSRWRLADVSGQLQLTQSGGSRTVAGQARSARLQASGGGSIETGPVGSLDAGASGGGRLQVGTVGGPLNADASGGGVIRVASVSGAVTAEASGGGGVSIAGGRSGMLKASASGGGWVDHDGAASGLSARASGGGRVQVASLDGPVRERSESGGGRVIVGR